MFKQIALIGILLISNPAFAQVFDFSSVEAVEKTKAINDEQEEIAAARKIAEEALKAQEAREAEVRRQHEIEAAKKALAERAYQDQKKDKTRDQAYEDELRNLELQTLQAKADRADDFIDADLARRAASTDGVQAGADRTRMGGEAEIQRAENSGINLSGSAIWFGLLIGVALLVIVQQFIKSILNRRQ